MTIIEQRTIIGKLRDGSGTSVKATSARGFESNSVDRNQEESGAWCSRKGVGVIVNKPHRSVGPAIPAPTIGRWFRRTWNSNWYHSSGYPWAVIASNGCFGLYLNRKAWYGWSVDPCLYSWTLQQSMSVCTASVLKWQLCSVVALGRRCIHTLFLNCHVQGYSLKLG